MTVYIRNEPVVGWQNLGRNGYSKAGGIAVSVMSDIRDGAPDGQVVVLEPLTGKGDIGRGSIHVAVEHIPALQAALAQMLRVSEGVESELLYGQFQAQRMGAEPYWYAVFDAKLSDWIRCEDGNIRGWGSMASAVDYVHNRAREEYKAECERKRADMAEISACKAA